MGISPRAVELNYDHGSLCTGHLVLELSYIEGSSPVPLSTWSIKVKIKAVDTTLPNDDSILHWGRLIKRGKVLERDYMESAVI